MKLSTPAAGLVLSVVAACGFSTHGPSTDSGGDGAPTVLSTTPSNDATGVALDGSLTAIFSEAMDPATLTETSFTLTSGSGVTVPGVVTYDNSMVVFRPSVDLASDGRFTATITTEARSASGVALATEHAWSFVGDTAAAGPPPVHLGTAGNYVILAKAAITGTGATIKGNLGISPGDASSITGLMLLMDATGVYWTSAQVTGRVYAHDNAPPTPTELAKALDDMNSAVADAHDRVADVTEVTDEIGGMTLTPAVYHWNSGVKISTNVTLAGGPKDVWLFQIDQGLGMTAGMKIILSGGAQAKNVFWHVSGPVTLGATAQFQGIVLAGAAVTSGMNTMITGRLLAQTAVTVTNSQIVEPL